MSKTLTAPQCAALPKLAVALLNLVDHIFSHKNVLIPRTTDLKTAVLLCYCRCLGREHPQWRRRGASGTSCAQHLVHGAGEPTDVSEFLKAIGAFGLLCHLLVLFSYSALLGLPFRSESLMC